MSNRIDPVDLPLPRTTQSQGINDLLCLLFVRPVVFKKKRKKKKLVQEAQRESESTAQLRTVDFFFISIKAICSLKMFCNFDSFLLLFFNPEAVSQLPLSFSSRFSKSFLFVFLNKITANLDTFFGKVLLDPVYIWSLYAIILNISVLYLIKTELH